VLVDLIFIEIPGWGLFSEWYLENGNIKGKIAMIGRTFNGAQHVFTILIFALNRFSAIKLPFKYKYVRSFKRRYLDKSNYPDTRGFEFWK
jgi:hypothetical protein